MTATTVLAALPSDVLHLVCEALLELSGTAHQNLDALSSTCKHVRSVALPLLLRSVSISSRVTTAENSAFKCIKSQLVAMASHSTVQRATQSFNFAPRPAGTFDITVYCPSFIKLLNCMTQLRELKFDTLIDPDDRDDFARLRSFFMNPDSTPRYRIEGITRLCTDDCSVFLLAACPQACTVKLEIIHRASSADLSFRTNWPVASHVQYLHLHPESYQWEHIASQTPEFCATITNSMPNVTTFVMDKVCDAQLVLPKFGGFAKLETLVIPDLGELGLGFSPPRCGNAYRGRRGNELRRRLEDDHRMAREKIKALARSVFPRLRRLWTGREDMCDFSKLRGSDKLDSLEFETKHFEPAWDPS